MVLELSTTDYRKRLVLANDEPEYQSAGDDLPAENDGDDVDTTGSGFAG